MTQSTTGDLLEDEEEDEALVHGHRKRKVAFEPSPGMSITISMMALIPINASRARNHAYNLLPRSLAESEH